jgi:ubiquinone/menaquinone biosynthesis C-methylase UbiE
MSSRGKSTIKAVRGYYNSPQTVRKFSVWAPDTKRLGISAAHLGLDDVERFHSDPFRRSLEVLLHRRAVERMTRLIVAEAQVEDGQTVLDAGCGTGAVAFPIAERHPSSSIFGVSLSRSQLEIAQKYQQSAGLQNTYFCEQDFTELAFKDASFDRVIFAESFCHAPDKRETISEVGRVLNPGGKVLIVDPMHLKPPPPDQEPLREALGSTEGLAMANLPTIDELTDWISHAGMQVEYVLDLTERAKASLALIANGYVAALTQRRAEPSALIDSYLAWHLLTAQGPLGYALIRAFRPAS